MNEGLRKTWDEVAHHWDDWGPPLRPCGEDLLIMQRDVLNWHRRNPAIETARVFLCGVTPEIATMSFPFPVDLTAMDQAGSMVRIVWPGDIPGVRRAIVGNWLKAGLPPGSQDIVIGDGGFGFFDYPNSQRALAIEMHKLLTPGGLFHYRHYAQIDQRETLAQVFDAARAGQIGNFHIFKWRLAMALQSDSRTGVKQHDIWQVWMDANIDSTRLPQPGWSDRALSTIHFYREKQARLYFPTLQEFRDLLAERFRDIEVTFPTYELGERCPILKATAQIGAI